MDSNFLTGSVVRGVYRIYNLKTDQTYLGVSEDIAKSAAEERFKLDLGMHANKELQKDYTTTGLELFVIDTLVVADKDEDLDQLLAKVKKEYKEKSIPLYS